MAPYDDDIHDLDPFDSPEPYWSDRGRLRDRINHLVLLDGRLIDTWSEPVEGTRWQHVAEEFDREKQRPAAPPSPPARHPHESSLDWLDSLVGGRVALEALTDDPLPVPPLVRVDELPLAGRHRVEGVSRALDVLSDLFDAETGRALKSVLAALWEENRDVVLSAKSAAQVAGGICWMVGRANDQFGKDKITQQAVQKQLGLRTTVSSFGSTVHRALRGLQPTYAERPWSQRDLLATGRAEFLTSATRRRLIRLRDQAVAARESWLADEERKAAVLP